MSIFIDEGCAGCTGNCRQGREDCECNASASRIADVGHAVVAWVCPIAAIAAICLVAWGVL
jgi:hypothetical protein